MPSDLRSPSAGLKGLSTSGPLLSHLTSADRAAMRRALARFNEVAAKTIRERDQTQRERSRVSHPRRVSMQPRRDTSRAHVVLLFGLAGARDAPGHAAFLVHHPERRALVPRLHPLPWRRLANLERFGVIRVRDDILILGGYDVRRKRYKRQVLRYDLRRGRTYVCAKMTTPRADFTPFLLDGRVYCVGGRSRDGQLTRAAEYFEPMMGRWYNDSTLPQSCADYGVVSTDREAVLIGGVVPGERAQQVASSHVWVMRKEFGQSEEGFDTLVSVWRPQPDLAFPSSRGIYKHRCALVADTRRVYVVGGSRDGGPKTDPKAPDPPASSGDYGLYYIQLDDILRRRQDSVLTTRRIFWQRRDVEGCRRVGAGVVTVGRRIFVLGGRRPEGPSEGAETSVGCFDSRTKAWLPLFELTEDAVDLGEVACVLLEPNTNMREIDFDRLDWMLQWALW